MRACHPGAALAPDKPPSRPAADNINKGGVCVRARARPTLSTSYYVYTLYSI